MKILRVGKMVHPTRSIEKMLLENYESSIQLTVMIKNIHAAARELNQIPKMNDTHTDSPAHMQKQKPTVKNTHIHTLTRLQTYTGAHSPREYCCAAYIPLHNSSFLIQIYEDKRDKATNRERASEKDPSVSMMRMTIIIGIC